jgi:hypothetical protein
MSTSRPSESFTLSVYPFYALKHKSKGPAYSQKKCASGYEIGVRELGCIVFKFETRNLEAENH